MSISSTEEISSFDSDSDSLENSDDLITSESDTESINTSIPASIREFLGRASESIFPSVTSFFTNGHPSEEDERYPNNNRSSFFPFPDISSTLSDVFRPSVSLLFNQTLRAYSSSMMRRSETQKSQLNMGGKGKKWINF